MKNTHRQAGELMQKLSESQSSVSPLEDTETEGLHAIRTLEKFKEALSDLCGPVDSGMWKWAVGSHEAVLIVNRWEDLGSVINKTGLVKLTLGEIQSVIHPEDLQSMKEDLLTHLEGEAVDSVGFEFRVRGKLGDWRWVRAETEVVQRDHEGKPVQAVGCFADISEVCAILERFAVGERLGASAKSQIRFAIAKSRVA